MIDVPNLIITCSINKSNLTSSRTVKMQNLLTFLPCFVLYCTHTVLYVHMN